MRPLFLACCLALGIAVTSFAASPAGNDIAGDYYLKGVREVGSVLLLKSDHTFEMSTSYGAVDSYTSGSWQQQGKALTLTSKPLPAPKFRVMAEEELRLKRPAETGTWIAVVGVPRVGPLGNIEVRFATAQGEVGQATTVANGDAILVPKDPKQRWQKAGLRRAGTQDAWQWLDVPAKRAQERIAAFAVDDPAYLQQPAFTTLELQREGATLVVPARNGQPRMVYSR